MVQLLVCPVEDAARPKISTRCRRSSRNCGGHRRRPLVRRIVVVAAARPMVSRRTRGAQRDGRRTRGAQRERQQRDGLLKRAYFGLTGP